VGRRGREREMREEWSEGGDTAGMKRVKGENERLRKSDKMALTVMSC
jgi:hypothetical protein